MSPLVVFSSSCCPYCKQAINALKGRNLKPLVVDIDDDLLSLLGEKTGSSSVPSVWVGDKYVGGCNDGPESWMGVVPNLKNGKLQHWIKELAKKRSSDLPVSRPPPKIKLLADNAVLNKKEKRALKKKERALEQEQANQAIHGVQKKKKRKRKREEEFAYERVPGHIPKHKRKTFNKGGPKQQWQHFNHPKRGAKKG